MRITACMAFMTIMLHAATATAVETGQGRNIVGLGVTGAFHCPSIFHNRNDGSIDLSFRYGFYDPYMSMFITADAGWRFGTERLVVRTGAEVIIGAGALGVHVDVFESLRVRERRFFTVPGISAGAVTSYPSNPSFTLFVGGQWYNESRPEFVMRLSVVYDLFGTRGVFDTPAAGYWRRGWRRSAPASPRKHRDAADDDGKSEPQ